MRPDTTHRRFRHLLLAAIAVLLCTSGLVAGVTQPASAAPKPAKVKGVKLKKPRVDGTTASFKVKWKRTARATSYKVKWKVPGGKARKARTGKTSHVIDGLAQGANYCVKVRAYSGKRKGKWSKQVCRTSAQLAPVQPVWVDRQQPQGGTVALTFRWNEVPGATSYELDYVKGEKDIQKQKKKKKTKTVTVGGSGSGVASVTVPGFEPSATYCFQVRPSGRRGVGAFGVAGCKYTEPLSRTVGGPLHLNVMTWNMCTAVCTGDRDWSLRKDAATARIGQIAPDAVATQESGQALDDFDAMPDYSLACKVGDGAATQPGLPAGAKNQGLLVRDAPDARFDVVAGTANGWRFLPDNHGGCWVVVEEVANPARRLVLASVHLIQPAAGSDQLRLDQMSAFWNALHADPNTFGLPIVIAGDFNSDRTRPLDGPRVLLNANGYDDAFDVAESYNSLPYVNSWNNWSIPPPISLRWGAHVDRVFVPPNARVTSWQMEQPFAGSLQLSDHSPVRVTVEIP
ncbi:fibronectin type III domain-containing protein [Nocardioides sp. L-11A]|uniref:fibronectin type III domain-containing protein n=1 Tax=Nocardioides sp. L-11A TaxID=3043848 RepID=UPI00249A63BB|nr:fibronectin type III domain-containing protein [Nocardioides sp. L-11A]